MTKNLGYYDISLRIISSLCLLILFVINDSHTPLSWLFLLTAAGLLLTALSGSCPFYRVFHVSTRSSRKPKKQLH